MDPAKAAQRTTIHGAEGKRRRRIINEFRGPGGFYRGRDTHTRCFDSLAVSNNIRYFYHISGPLAPWPLFAKEHVLVLES